MNPLSLRATNLRTYPHLDWQIPDGVAAIIGPNGAGKSTLLNGIELALFADGARDLAPALGPHGERLELELVFEHNSEQYRVRRGYTAGGRGKATLDFEICQHYAPVNDQESWSSLTRESAAATQALIVATLGLSRPTFNASAFLAQGNAGAFPEASPAERKALLGEILDPRRQWPQFAERAIAERKTVEAAQAGVHARIADREAIVEHLPRLTEQLKDATDFRADMQTRYAVAERELVAAQAALAANEAAAIRLSAATQALAEAQNRRDNAADTLTAANEQAELLLASQERLTELSAISATVPDLERKADAQREALAAAALSKERLEAAIRHAAQLGAAANEARLKAHAQLLEQHDLQTQIQHLETAADGTERCVLCEQTLGAEGRAATLINRRAQLITLNQEIAAYAPEVLHAGSAAQEASAAVSAIVVLEVSQADYSTPLAQARRAAEERAGLEVTITNLEREAERVTELRETHIEAESLLAERIVERARVACEHQDGAELARNAETARAAQQSARTRLDAAQADLVRAQEKHSYALASQGELVALREQSRESNQRLDLLRLAERACGRDGIPALIAENTVGVLEAEANRILERLPTANGTAFRVELRTQRALKSDASALRETLDILVSDRQSTREYLTYSGGEQWRVSFALRWALARLLAGRRGAESRLLVIDEPDGLDAGGMDGLAAVLREEQGGFEKILVVSHNPLLASAFEQVVEVESDGEVSRLVGVTEEVAA